MGVSLLCKFELGWPWLLILVDKFVKAALLILGQEALMKVAIVFVYDVEGNCNRMIFLTYFGVPWGNIFWGWRETERDRERERQRDRERKPDRQIDRQTDRQRRTVKKLEIRIFFVNCLFKLSTSEDWI